MQTLYVMSSYGNVLYKYKLLNVYKEYGVKYYRFSITNKLLNIKEKSNYELILSKDTIEDIIKQKERVFDKKLHIAAISKEGFEKLIMTHIKHFKFGIFIYEQRLRYINFADSHEKKIEQLIEGLEDLNKDELYIIHHGMLYIGKQIYKDEFIINTGEKIRFGSTYSSKSELKEAFEKNTIPLILLIEWFQLYIKIFNERITSLNKLLYSL